MNEYFWWRMADYFSRWLIGDETVRPVAIEEMDKDMPQAGNKGGSNREPRSDGEYVDEDEDDGDW
jgi:hypothetical protein